MVSASFPKTLIPPRWTPDVVAEWIIEAMETAAMLPGHKPQTFKVAWPDVQGERWDYRDPSKYDEEIRCTASRAQITRHDEVQRWLMFVDETEREVLKHWARNKPDIWIGRKLIPATDHRKVKRMRAHALRLIALRLTLEGGGVA